MLLLELLLLRIHLLIRPLLHLIHTPILWLIDGHSRRCGKSLPGIHILCPEAFLEGKPIQLKPLSFLDTDHRAHTDTFIQDTISSFDHIACTFNIGHKLLVKSHGSEPPLAVTAEPIR